MKDLECLAQLYRTTFSAKEVDGVLRRRIVMKFRREFDDLVADALGKGAKNARASLAGRDASKVIMPIDRVVMTTTLAANDQEVKIDIAVGIKATATIGKGEVDQPMVLVEFECPYTRDLWVFLGDNGGAVARVKFSKAQTSLEDAWTRLGRRKVEVPATTTAPEPAQAAG